LFQAKKKLSAINQADKGKYNVGSFYFEINVDFLRLGERFKEKEIFWRG